MTNRNNGIAMIIIDEQVSPLTEIHWIAGKIGSIHKQRRLGDVLAEGATFDGGPCPLGECTLADSK